MRDKASGFRMALVEIFARQEVGPSCREKVTDFIDFFFFLRKNIKLVSREVGGPGRN